MTTTHSENIIERMSGDTCLTARVRMLSNMYGKAHTTARDSDIRGSYETLLLLEVSTPIASLDTISGCAYGCTSASQVPAR